MCGLTGRKGRGKKKKRSDTTLQGIKAMCSVQTWPQCGRKSSDLGVHLYSRRLERGCMQCNGQSTF